jgi:hypothetical protein
MSAHTKGRLRLPPRDDWAIQTEDGRVDIATFLETTPGCNRAQKNHNRRRIVALWNAAEELGLTTEAIEAGAIQDAFDDRATLNEAAEEAAWGDAIRSLTQEDSKQ